MSGLLWQCSGGEMPSRDNLQELRLHLSQSAEYSDRDLPSQVFKISFFIRVLGCGARLEKKQKENYHLKKNTNQHLSYPKCLL